MGMLDLKIDIERGTRWKDRNRRVERLKTRSAPVAEPEPSSEITLSTSEVGQRTHSGIDAEDDEGNTDMDLTLYLAAMQGDVDEFIRVLEEVSTEKGLLLSDIFNEVSPIGNTYLHIAASEDLNDEIVALIAHHSPPLITKKNFNGDTALHLAARAGNYSILENLIKFQKEYVDSPSDEKGKEQEIDWKILLLRFRNEKGNTALHEALMNSHRWTASFLIEEDPEVAFYPNNQLESPLYLAAKAGIKELVSLILSYTSFPEVLATMTEHVNVGKSPVHAAIDIRSIDVLELMLQKAPRFVYLSDEEGRYPLHYAASMGYLKEVGLIIHQFAWTANQRDKNGLLPIHWASIKGHVAVIKELLLHCLEPRELLDKNGRSILHFAAKSGKSEVLGYVLKDEKFEVLINMKDKQGNTPLHLAALHWHPKIVSALTWDSRVNLAVENDEGMTALDAAEYYMKNASPFKQRLTWTALKAGGVPRAQPKKILHVDRQMSMPVDTIKSENYKDRVNTLLLVSTLVATITFAAGFTMPGGYNSSDPYEGMATMLEQKKFHVFIFCDTIAMYSAIIVAVSLIWAQLGDLHLVLVALRLALPLLGIALSMMSLAFMAGVSVVVSKLKWLDNAILITGVVFLVILLALFFPLCFPISSNQRLLRYIFYYPFCLLIFVTKADHQVD